MGNMLTRSKLEAIAAFRKIAGAHRRDRDRRRAGLHRQPERGLLGFDALNGCRVLRFDTGAPIGGGVVTYAVDGKQYLAVSVGLDPDIWKMCGAARRVVLALDGRAGDGLASVPVTRLVPRLNSPTQAPARGTHRARRAL